MHVFRHSTNVARRCSAATSEHIHKTTIHKIIHQNAHFVCRLVIFSKLIRKTRIGIGRDIDRSHARQVADILAKLLRAEGMDEVLVTAGGIIPEEDIPALKAAGVSAIFGPGTAIGEIASYMREHAQQRPG